MIRLRQFVLWKNLTGKLRDGTKFETFNVGSNDALIARLEQNEDVIITGANPPEPQWWANLASIVVPFIILMVIFFLLCSKRRAVATGS